MAQGDRMNRNGSILGNINSTSNLSSQLFTYVSAIMSEDLTFNLNIYECYYFECVGEVNFYT